MFDLVVFMWDFVVLVFYFFFDSILGDSFGSVFSGSCGSINICEFLLDVSKFLRFFIFNKFFFDD